MVRRRSRDFVEVGVAPGEGDGVFVEVDADDGFGFAQRGRVDAEAAGVAAEVEDFFAGGEGGQGEVMAFLVILIESVGAVLLVLGVATRFVAFAVIVNFIGIVVTSHSNSGFFMNWYKQAGVSEGIEYFILFFGLAIISLIAGGGKASVDAAIVKTK